MPSGVYKRTKEGLKNLSLAHLGKPNKFKGKKRPHFCGKNHPRWKGGAKTPEYRNKYNIERRHRLGISKRYNSELGISYTKEYKRLHRKKYKYMLKHAGELTVDKIQMVYEDNIKKYGTLTCYLCCELIVFGQDSLEHKTPLSRGGTNDYNNLGIAHISCNKKKHTMTEKEYRRILYHAGHTG